MTVTLIQKDKGKGKNKVAAKEKSDLDVKVDRLIKLKVEIDAVKSSIAEYEKLRKELSALSDTISAANEQVLFSGELGDVTFSPKSFERTITDMPKVFELLGQDTFLKIAKITMTDIDKYLGAAEKEAVVAEELTGARKINVLPKEKLVTQESA